MSAQRTTSDRRRRRPSDDSTNEGVMTMKRLMLVWMMILCSIVMALGTSIGGYRIIKQVGMNMARLETYQGFAADTAATLCLFVSSLLGMSVSTTQTKTTAIMGVGAAKRMRSVDWTIVKEMVFTWICTFPGCGLVGFLMAKLFILIFK